MRLIVGVIVMGVLLPLALFWLLGLTKWTELATLSASIFLTWGVADLLSSLLDKPRLRGRSPSQAIGEEWKRRSETE
jgi:hypothetical protein